MTLSFISIYIMEIHIYIPKWIWDLSVPHHSTYCLCWHIHFHYCILLYDWLYHKYHHFSIHSFTMGIKVIFSCFENFFSFFTFFTFLFSFFEWECFLGYILSCEIAGPEVYISSAFREIVPTGSPICLYQFSFPKIAYFHFLRAPCQNFIIIIL